MSEPITSGQSLRLGAEVANGLSAARFPGKDAQSILESQEKTMAFREGVVNLARSIIHEIHEPQPSVALQTTIAIILEEQAAKLIETGAHKELKIARGRYEDQLQKAINVFQWNRSHDIIGLTKFSLVDYRLRDQFLAEVINAYLWIDLDKCTFYPGIIIPDGPVAIQAQWGEKYIGNSPCWCRNNFHKKEQGLIIKEGLTAVLYNGIELLGKCSMDLLGSVSKNGKVPCLDLDDGRTVLDSGISDGISRPDYGSGSRGK